VCPYEALKNKAMSVKEKLATLKASLPKKEAVVKIVEKVVTPQPVDFSKEFFKTFSQDAEALPDFESSFGKLSTAKKKNVLVNLEYYFLLSKSLKGESTGSSRNKVAYQELLGHVQKSEKEGYKQSEVAVLLGVTPSAVASYVKAGKLKIDAKVISKQSLISFLQSK
jgi:hypothetical protein